MLQAIYISEVTQPVPKHQLDRMIERCRINNRAKGVTGLLVRDGGVFLQVIEGPRGEVEALLDSIGLDGRHSGMRLLNLMPITSRQFDNGPLGYIDVDRRNSLPEPYLKLRPRLKQLAIGRVEARRLLELFTSGSQDLAAIVIDDPRQAGQPAT